jgi:hypothetical protein
VSPVYLQTHLDMKGWHLQLVVALLLGAGLSAGGFVRVYLSTHNVISAAAITASLLFIVLTSGLALLVLLQPLNMLMEPTVHVPLKASYMLVCAAQVSL